MAVEKLIVDHIDTWTTARQTRSTAGRGSSGKIDLYGIKKLRELILELAVRGKLVPQDPNDEPASVLLKRIAAEKAELVKQGKIKKPKPLPEISEGEKPFELPEEWEWVRLSDLMEVINGRAYKKHEMLQEGTPLLRVGNLFTSNEWYYSDLELDENKYIDNGDLIYAWSASFGPFIWTGQKVIYHYHIWKLKLFAEELSDKFFIHDFLLSITEKIKSQGNGIAMLHMTKERMEQQVIALPPVNEQKNIVQKIRELMSLCDQLEQHSLTSLDAHQQLVETLLTTLTDSQNANELAENWARISEYFDTLFTTEASIDALKQTILQLAVMGKLVPQDPNDEPASELLKRIEQEKAQLVKDGKIKKQKPLPPISDEEKPFELPDGWEWCKFGLISEFINGDRGSNYPNKNEYVVHGIPWINTGHIEKNGTLSITDMNFITEKKFNELRSGKIQSGDLVYCLRGATFGKTAFVKPYESGAIASSLMIIRPFIREMGEYIYNYLISPFGRSQIFRFDNGSAQPNLSANSVMLYAFACPPLQEQFRIHKKITELFHICDNLKLQTQSAQQTQLHLADALTDAVIN
ncbi:restriction endonuclease subunit S [Salmonella enterica]|nr:restriction endonuclease subunit S [Salmonella enterica]EDR6669928.1 restriction endonuclease subunit S [Salmonella enterica subsp. enterica]EDX6226926.1 restriction endonuclease subunit S [Salmonella enterica subsp. houtenae]HCM1967282.1 restriction endonuclease subunit S [Salmonella enterica subsp. houtenae serovar 41:z29:-]EAU0251250.1 restriction endonuclease subunit S [Salmonella enterica]